MKRILIPIILLIVATPSEATWQLCRLRHEGDWYADYPTADQNLIAMLKDVTTIDVNPTPIVVATNEEELSQCAFIYTSNIDFLFWSPDEAKAIGDWVQKGGFLWTDGFWTDMAWAHWTLQLEKAFPKAEIRELNSHHPIFNYPFRVRLQQYDIPEGGWVKNFAVEDNRGRLMILMTFNEKLCNCGVLGDSWQGFTKNWQNEQATWGFSINVILHIMTN